MRRMREDNADDADEMETLRMVVCKRWLKVTEPVCGQANERGGSMRSVSKVEASSGSRRW